MPDYQVNPVESLPDFRALVDCFSDVLLYFNRARRCTYANQAFERVTGLASELYLGRTFDEIELTDNLAGRAERQQTLERVFISGQEEAFRMALTTPTGEHTLAGRYVPEVAADNTVKGVWWIARALTAPGQSAPSLVTRAVPTQAASTPIPDALLRVHRDGTYLDFQLLTAPTNHDFLTPPLIGRKIQDLFSPEIASPMWEHLQQALATGEVQIFETIFPLSGAAHYGESRVVPLNQDEVFVVFRDITERKRIEEEWRLAAELGAFRAALADALRPLADPLEIQRTAIRVLGECLQVDRVFYAEIAADEETMVVADNYVNGVPKIIGQVRSRDFGKSMAKLRAGQALIIADVTNDTTLLEEERAALLALDIRSNMSLPLVKGGRWFANLSVHYRSPRTWQAHDITFLEETAERIWAAVERARAEAALRESEEKYRTLFATIDEGYLLCDVLFNEQGEMVDLLYLEANPAAIRMMGGDYTGRRFTEINSDACALDQFASWGRVARTGQSEQMELYVDPTGAWFDLYVFKPQRGNAASRQVAVLSHDNTKRKTDEALLRRSEEAVRRQLMELEAIYAGAPVGLCILDRQLRFMRLNAMLAEINRKTVAEHLEQPLRVVVEPPLADYLEPILQQVLTSGQAVKQMEIHETWVTDAALARTWLSSYYPLRDAAGVVIGISCMVAEVSKLKQTERALLWANTLLEEQVDVRTAELRLANAALHTRIAEHERSVADLQRSKERYRHLVEMMPDALLINEGGRLAYVNPAFLRMVGATAPEQILGKSPFEFYHPVSHALIQARLRRLLDEGGTLPPIDVKVVCLDGTIIDVETAASCYQDREGTILQAIWRDVTQRKQAEEQRNAFLTQLATQRLELRLLNHQVATAQDDERKRLARELHDQVGQNLTALTISLTLFQEQITHYRPSPTELLRGFDEAHALVTQISDNVRDLLSGLHPPMLDEFGLLASIRWYSEALARRTTVPIRVSGTEPKPPLAEPVALALIRIMQEALTNVVKHAQASQAEVNLWTDATAVHLLIEDNGRGFDPTQLTNSIQHPHWGLLNIRERAAAVGGQVTIESQPQQGTVVHVEVPLPLSKATASASSLGRR